MVGEWYAPAGSPRHLEAEQLPAQAGVGEVPPLVALSHFPQLPGSRLAARLAGAHSLRQHGALLIQVLHLQGTTMILNVSYITAADPRAC